MSISGSDIKRLHGKHIAIHDRHGDVISLEFLPPARGFPRGGSEAYVMEVLCRHPRWGVVRSVLKIFKEPLVERRPRTAYLIRMGLDKLRHPLFQAFPYAACSGLKVEGLELHGHVSRTILGPGGDPGEDIGQLRDCDRWTFSLADRKRLAGELCCAVAAFEARGIVHSDLSQDNLLIGLSADGRPALVVCDPDAFTHATQPLLPAAFRPYGTPGYRYPALLDRLRAGDDALVETDRFALGALVCEIVAWGEEQTRVCRRASLLTDEYVLRRDLGALPASIVHAFPRGIRLLERALRADSPSTMPGPVEWLDALRIHSSVRDPSSSS
jgi:serine/threonine protein kinase